MTTRSRPTAVCIGLLIYWCAMMVIGLLVRRGTPRRILEAELITLRHQVALLRRHIDRVEFTDTDRSVLDLPRPRRVAFVVTP